jgi:hypothetical protein
MQKHGELESAFSRCLNFSGAIADTKHRCLEEEMPLVHYRLALLASLAAVPAWGQSSLADAGLKPSSGDALAIPLAGNTPRNMVQIRSQAFANGTIPSHARVDSSLVWKASESVELSLTGQNLLRPEFLEFFEDVVGTEAPRSRIGKIVCRS